MGYNDDNLISMIKDPQNPMSQLYSKMLNEKV